MQFESFGSFAWFEMLEVLESLEAYECFPRPMNCGREAFCLPQFDELISSQNGLVRTYSDG